jgi:hypothetical protein
MDEPPVSRERADDADAPLARDSDWFAHLLGEGWHAEEPGIYRFVDTKRPSSGGVENRPERKPDEAPETPAPERRWAPWRRQ